jgi:Phage integrase family
MSRYRVSLTPAEWPSELRARFEAGLGRVSTDKRSHLERGFGRWLKAAQEEGVPPDLVGADLWRRRTTELDKRSRGDVREALATVYPEKRVELYAPPSRRPVRSEREKLAALIDRHLKRWPDDWRIPAEPLLRVDPEGADDGILVQAWSPATIEGRVNCMSAHFAYCRKNGRPVDITPATVREHVRHRQARWEAGDLRIGGTAIYLMQLAGLASAVRPDRSWKWLRIARDRMRKIAENYPSRNSGRVVEVVELRLAAQELMRDARRSHRRARTHRERIGAHTQARTGLGIFLLCETPVRIGSLAGIEIGLQLTSNYRTISLAPHETKEGQTDQRCLSDEAVAMIAEFVRVHRAVVAPADERRVFVGTFGEPLSPKHLSRIIGDYCEERFKTRATPHCVRNSVADYIVSESPGEAALATTILNHRDPKVTESYVKTANQVIAGRALRKAADETARAVGAVASGRRPAGKPARQRSLRAELAARALARQRAEA